jgi:hypothetical protein
VKTSLHAAALLVALAAGLAGCASSLWQRVERVSSGGVEGRLYVPKLYAPLLPGSIYPDKKTAIPAKGRPALVVVCPVKGDCRKGEILEQAARRGLVVFVVRPASALQKIDLLRNRAEVDADQIGWLLVEPNGDFLRRWTGAGAPGAAAAVIGSPPRASPGLPSSPSKKILFASSLSEAPLEAPDGTVLKLYSPNEKGLLPREAFRDAVEWLAGELGTR